MTNPGDGSAWDHALGVYRMPSPVPYSEEERALWDRVVIARITAGNSTIVAVEAADYALMCRRKRFANA